MNQFELWTMLIYTAHYTCRTRARLYECVLYYGISHHNMHNSENLLMHVMLIRQTCAVKHNLKCTFDEIVGYFVGIKFQMLAVVLLCLFHLVNDGNTRNKACCVWQTMMEYEKKACILFLWHMMMEYEETKCYPTEVVAKKLDDGTRKYS